MSEWAQAVRQRLVSHDVDPTRHSAVIDELAQHLDERYAALLARGMAVSEARRTVAEELEDEALERELRRMERGQPPSSPAIGASPGSGVLSSLAQDLGYAARTLRSSPGFSAIAIITLALGVGMNTAIFSVLNAVMLRPLPYRDPDRLVRLFESNPQRGWPEFSVSHPNFLDWRAQTTRWDMLVATFADSVALVTDEGAEMLRGSRVTAEFLPALGVAPILGRNFTPDEVAVGATGRSVILTEGFWQRRFGRDPAVVGRTVTMNSAPHTIVGVLPRQFEWGDDLDVLLPLVLEPNRSRGDHVLTVFGRLKPTATLDQARAELTTIAANLGQQYPADNDGWSVRLRSFYDWLIPEQTRQSLVVLQGAVALVLLIACVNIANLLLARGAARQKELAIRVALGASRKRLLCHGAAESLLLALIGSAAGLVLAGATIRLLSSYGADIVPRLNEAHIDLTAIGFAVISGVASAALFGLMPSWQAARNDAGQVLSDGARGSTGGQTRQRLRRALTITEVAFSVALLVGAGLLVRSFSRLQKVDAGFDVDTVMTARVTLADRTAFDSNAKRAAFWQRVNAEVGALPGIVSVSSGSGVPLTPVGGTATELRVPGFTPPRGTQPSADWRVITPGYFKTLGIPLRGRDFTDGDGPTVGPSVIVSESLVRRYFPDQDPIGKAITPRTLGNRPHTIIGVAGDVRGRGLDRDPLPTIYFSAVATPAFGTMTVVWRSIGEGTAHVSAIREALRRIHPQVAMFDVRAINALLETSFAQRRFNVYLLTLFASVALVLAAIGLFGVMAYLVSQRTREIGVRLALGADRGQVFRLIIGRGVALAGVGAVLGVGLALWLSRLMETLLFGVSPLDPITFAAVPTAMITIAAAACYVPARRAMRVDPVTALRAE